MKPNARVPNPRLFLLVRQRRWLPSSDLNVRDLAPAQLTKGVQSAFAGACLELARTESF